MIKNHQNHKIIIDLIFEHTSKQNINQLEITEKDRIEIQKLIFLNQYTLQLSRHGFVVLSKIFKHYEINFPKDYILKSKDLIILDKICIFPYYINVKQFNKTINYSQKDPILYLFEKELAMLLKLNDCDLHSIKNITRDGIF